MLDDEDEDELLACDDEPESAGDRLLFELLVPEDELFVSVVAFLEVVLLLPVSDEIWLLPDEVLSEGPELDEAAEEVFELLFFLVCLVFLQAEKDNAITIADETAINFKNELRILYSPSKIFNIYKYNSMGFNSQLIFIWIFKDCFSKSTKNRVEVLIKV